MTTESLTRRSEMANTYSDQPRLSRADAKRLRLRDGLADDKPVVAEGAHAAMSARLIGKYDFDAVWVSGFGVSAMAYGLPDLNLVTMSETLAVTRAIEGATELPVVVDCDNGFGGFRNFVRTAGELDRGGMAPVCIEDNLFPKRNSLYQGKSKRELIPTREQARRLKAAGEGKDSEAFVVIARVEALIAGHGVDAAIERASAYAEAGADAVLIHSKDKTLTEITDFLDAWHGTGIDKPLVAVP